MEKDHKQNLHIGLLVGAFIVALAFRLIRLGRLPLGDGEAMYALQALAVARGGDAVFGSLSAYVGLTGFDFFFFSASDFLARFWPALIGALIVFVPHLFRDQIGRWPALALSFVLAFSPEMVGLSRIIGSPMMAFVLLLLAVGFLFRRKPILSGGMFALGLMSGAAFWTGVLILGFALLISEWLFNFSEILDLPEVNSKKTFRTQWAIAFGVTLLVVGTGFFLRPANLSGVLSGLVEFSRGFRGPSLAPLFHIPLALVAYAAGALVFGIWGGIRALLVRSRIDMFLLVWAFFAFAFILLYPGGTAADIIWVTLPLWLLGVRLLVTGWRLPEIFRGISAATAIFVVVVFAFLLLALRGLLNPAVVGQGGQVNFLIAIIGGVVLLVAVVLLVSFGWSQEVALPGLILGVVVVMAAGMFALSVHTTGLAPEPSDELWLPAEARVTDQWLRESVDRVKGWQALRTDPLEIVVSDWDNPSMHWFLRDEEAVSFAPYVPPQTQPAMLITSDREILEIANSYRGQDLVWYREALWSQMTPYQYLQWLVTHDAPGLTEQVIFWVRTDLTPDSQFSN
ncbi:hypothetical protein KQH62_02470 [bacterium]|nr:hypothetical protein [bacterium]